MYQILPNLAYNFQKFPKLFIFKMNNSFASLGSHDLRGPHDELRGPDDLRAPGYDLRGSDHHLGSDPRGADELWFHVPVHDPRRADVVPVHVD